MTKQNPLIEGIFKSFVVLADLSSVKNIIPINILYTFNDFYWRPKVQERKIKYPEIQIFDLRAFVLVTNCFKEVDKFLNYLFQRYTLYKKHPQFIVYEDNLLSYYLNNNNSFNTLLDTKKSNINRVFAKGPDGARLLTFLTYCLPCLLVSEMNHAINIHTKVADIGPEALEPDGARPLTFLTY